MRYRLGLDLGTNSIGWAILALDEESCPTKIINFNSRIFSDGRVPKTGASLAEARRKARGIRRRYERLTRRKKKLKNILIRHSFFPKSLDEGHSLKNKDVYYLRTKALDEKIEKFELGRALLHIDQRRGFKSNRKENKKDKDSKKNLEKIKFLKTEIDMSNARTLGEFLYEKRKKNPKARLRFHNLSELYPERAMYQNEFEMILAKQSEFYPELEKNSKIYTEIFDSIFYQRPLKEQYMGYCQIYLEEKEENKRAYRAIPSFQRFRLNQDIMNLKFSEKGGGWNTLSEDQRKQIREAIKNKKTTSYSKIKTMLSLDDNSWFNLKKSKDVLKGDSTSYTLSKKEFFGKKWKELNLSEKDQIVHKIITTQSVEKLKNILSQYKLSEEQTDNVCKLNEEDFEKGTARYSAKALRELNRLMESEHMIPSEAISKLTKKKRSHRIGGTALLRGGFAWVLHQKSNRSRSKKKDRRIKVLFKI